MSILSYKQWKLLQENFDTVIGISKPTSIGIQTEAPQLVSMLDKMKKMHGGVPHKPGLDPDADMDDEDHPHDDAGADMDDTESDIDDAGDDDEEDMGDDMGDEEGGDEEDMGDEEGGDMGMGMGMGGPGAEPMAGAMGPGAAGMGKKKPMPPAVPPMMKKMGAMYMKKEVADVQDNAMKAKNKAMGMNDQNLNKGGKKCCNKCNKSSKKCCKMTKEQREFNDSLMRQAGALKFEKDELGFWVPVKEDVLIPVANNQSQQKVEDEPQISPGDVGFAPQQKIGILGSNFTEWVSKYKK